VTGVQTCALPISKLHLTLRFLGDIQVPLAMALEDACGRLSACQRFDIAFTGIGAFPDARSPRVVWMGIEDPTGGLAAVHSKLTGILAEKGFPPEKRKFSPHLTIGRVRSGRADMEPILDRFSGQSFGTESVTRIIFYRSILDGKGAVHEPKWAVSFGRERGSQ
jgi:2'-5' RNA ligase